MAEYVVYYRVSTERQGRSGLGLEAQRAMVEQFLTSTDQVIAEFTEIQSGKRDDRAELWNAINLVKKTRSKLLIPKLDRFSRKVSFISGIIDQGIELVVCEHPNVTTFFLHLLACFAEEERRQISERTRAALRAAKNRGWDGWVVLGFSAASRLNCFSSAIGISFATPTASYGSRWQTTGRREDGWLAQQLVTPCAASSQ